MILFKNNKSGKILNIRESGHFNVQEKINELRQQLEGLPKNVNGSVKKMFQDGIDKLNLQYDAWISRRKNEAVKVGGGKPDDYEIIEVPKGMEHQVIKARMISIDEVGELNISTRPIFEYFPGGSVGISAGWISGEDVLVDDILIDLSPYPDHYFAVSAYKNTQGAVKIEGFVWSDTEDRASTQLPGMIYLFDICSGRIDSEGGIE